MRKVCERCGTDRCIDKRYVPYKYLNSYDHYKDCPRYYGPKPMDLTGNGAMLRADEQRAMFLRRKNVTIPV